MDAMVLNPVVEMVGTHPPKSKRPKRDRKDIKCWGFGGLGHSWRECSTPRQGNNLPFKPTNHNQN